MGKKCENCKSVMEVLHKGTKGSLVKRYSYTINEEVVLVQRSKNSSINQEEIT